MGHPRRDPPGLLLEAWFSPVDLPGAPSRADRARFRANRAERDHRPDRGGGEVPRGLRERQGPGHVHRRGRHAQRPRPCGPVPRSRHNGGAHGSRERPNVRPPEQVDRRASHDAHLHEHAERDGTRLLPFEGARRRRPRGPPRLSFKGHPPRGRAEAQRRSAEGGCVVHFPRTRNRHRLHRPRRPDWLAEVRRERVAADRPRRPCIRRNRGRADDRIRAVGPYGVRDLGEGRVRRPDRPGGHPEQSPRRSRPGARRDVARETVGGRRGVRARPAVAQLPRSDQERLPRGPRLPFLPQSGHQGLREDLVRRGGRPHREEERNPDDLLHERRHDPGGRDVPRLLGTRLPLGELSEKFVEYLSPSDIFVLGGRTYQFVRARGTSVYVKDASGRRPTVPSWTGEMLPRSFDLSIAVGEFRRDLAAKIAKDGEKAAKEWLMQEYRVDTGSAQSLTSYVQEQEALIPTLPTDRQVLLEGYLDVKGNRNVIFHFPFGRRVNDALSRAFAFAITEAHHTNVRVSVTDDNFMITVPRRIELKGLTKLVTSKNLEDLLRRAIRNTELFKQRFRHCATRSFMILRNYKGREVSIGRQQLRSQRVLDWLHEIQDFPVVKETYNEILHMVMDLDHAREILRRIEAGEIAVVESDFTSLPSPFAHNVVLQGVSDLVLMEDRSALLRELHRKVLERVMPTDQISSIQFQPGEIAEYFRRKLPKVARKEDILSYLDRVGDANLLQQKGRTVFEVASATFTDVRKRAGQLMD